MKKPRYILFIICSSLFILHQLLQYGLKIRVPLADAYLDNLLAMPIILTLLVEERRRIFRRGQQYQLPPLELALTTLYICVISELIFPIFSPRFTFDPIDFAFFFAGTAIYALVARKEIR